MNGTDIWKIILTVETKRIVSFKKWKIRQEEEKEKEEKEEEEKEKEEEEKELCKPAKKIKTLPSQTRTKRTSTRQEIQESQHRK